MVITLPIARERVCSRIMTDKITEVIPLPMWERSCPKNKDLKRDCKGIEVRIFWKQFID